MEVDYTQQLEALNAKLDSVYTASAHIDETLQALSNDEGIRIDDAALIDKLNGLSEVVTGSRVEGVDYSSQFEQLAQLLVYTDMLLLVLIVFSVLGVGAFVGWQITRSMRLQQ